MYISISRSRGKYKAKKIIGVWHGFRRILKPSRGVNQASLKLYAVFSNAVCWTSLSFFQCDQFLIRAQICKNTGRLRAHFLQKYERFTGKNTSADSQIFIFLKNGKTYFFNNAITQANLLFHSLFKNRKVNFQSAKMIIL